MAEQLSLTVPETITTYYISAILLDWDNATIRINVRDENGNIVKALYEGETATNLMTGLNKSDLSTNSLHKRILERLVSDGKLPGGTVTGTPD
jgi:hypothetical protein